jgi:hypothetical protein
MLLIVQIKTNSYNVFHMTVYLRLNNNSLEGTVPTEMGRLKKLGKSSCAPQSFVLLLRRLVLTRSLSNLLSVETMTLEMNDFSGSMPTEVCSLDLDYLVADCQGGDFACSCCDMCYFGGNVFSNGESV